VAVVTGPSGAGASGAGAYIDRRALREGLSVAALFALPFGVGAALLVDPDEPSGWSGLLALLVFGGLLLGAGVAAWRQRAGTPLTHGILTASTVFVVIQAAGLLRKLLADEPPRWGRIATSLMLSLLAGLVGGLLGSWMLRKGMRPIR
jgi:hypothetical protein